MIQKFNVMKKIYTTLFLLIGIYAKAQLTMVKDVAAAGITPISDKQVFWQNNKWNNKFYFNAGTTAILDVFRSRCNKPAA